MKILTSILTCFAFILVGCETPPSQPTVSTEQPPMLPGEVLLLDFTEPIGNHNLISSFAFCDGKALKSYFDLSLNSLRAYHIPEGRHRLAFQVTWRQTDKKWNGGQHGDNFGRGVLDVDLKAGHRYTAKGRYIFGEMACAFQIVDFDSGEPTTEEVIVNVNPRPSDWSVFMLIVPILIK